MVLRGWEFHVLAIPLVARLNNVLNLFKRYLLEMRRHHPPHVTQGSSLTLVRVISFGDSLKQDSRVLARKTSRLNDLRLVAPSQNSTVGVVILVAEMVTSW
jgi:hypothetical protein